MDPLPFELRVHADPAAPPEVHAFAQDRVVIGRGRESDLQLANRQKTVSRRHAEIHRAGGRLLLTDLGSKNTTRLNGLRLQPHRPYPLRPGDRLRIGDFDVELRLPAPTGGALPPDDLAPASPSELLTRLYPTLPEPDEPLRRTLADLVALSELAFEIGAARDVHAVADAVVRRAVCAVRAEHGALALLADDADDAVRTLVRVGPPERAFPTLPAAVPWMRRHPRPLRLDGRPRPDLPPGLALGPAARSLLCAPLVVQGRLLGLLTLHNKCEGAAFTEADERLVAVMAAQSAHVIENARLAEEERRLARVREELAAAERIQTSLLPTAAPTLPGYDVAGVSRPAAAVGGDYFDFVPLAEGRLGLAVGDVSGKGLAAALLMVRLQAVLRGLAHASASVRACVEEANALLRERAVRGTFVTLCCGVLSPRSHTFRYANAGHHRPLLLRAGGALETLRSTAPLLGALADFRCGEAAVDLRPGDVLLLYSDGITEARDAAGEEFGEERLAAVLREHASLPAAALVERAFEAVERHTGGAPAADDRTLVAVRRGA